MEEQVEIARLAVFGVESGEGSAPVNVQLGRSGDSTTRIRC